MSQPYWSSKRGSELGDERLRFRQTSKRSFVLGGVGAWLCCDRVEESAASDGIVLCCFGWEVVLFWTGSVASFWKETCGVERVVCIGTLTRHDCSSARTNTH